MPQIHNICSHLQNAFRARQHLTSLPYSKLNHSLLRILHRQGFLTSISSGSHLGPYQPTASPAQKRLWVELKYAASGTSTSGVMSEPVLSEIKTISKPSRRVFAEPSELRMLAMGRKCRRLQYVGLKSPVELGQVVVVNTKEGTMDLYEAVEKGLGGEVLCAVK
ncbi:30S ribosomal protein S8 [Paraphysoderma sedebokerense]|nr:30S ribosomal protein S8 [Paraphysoderma sedebokerense]